MGHQFILNTLLLLDIFETELYLTMKKTLYNYLRHAKVIGTDNEKESMKQYSRSVLWCFIEEQIVH